MSVVIAHLDRRWRQLGTGLSFAVFGLVGLVFGATLLPLVCLPARDAATAKRRAQWLVHVWFGAFARLMRTLGLLDWEIHGAERLARPGQLIVANHPTLVDVVLLLGYMPRMDCIVKDALFRNPFTRWPVTWAGYIGNASAGQLVGDCARTLTQGNSLLIFPEGTRSRPGERIRVKHGTARIALESGAMILPVTITCTPVMLTKGTPWYRVPPRPGHYVITVGEAYAPAPFLREAPSLAIAARRLSQHWERSFAEQAARQAAPCGVPARPATITA